MTLLFGFDNYWRVTPNLLFLLLAWLPPQQRSQIHAVSPGLMLMVHLLSWHLLLSPPALCFLLLPSAQPANSKTCLPLIPSSNWLKPFLFNQ